MIFQSVIGLIFFPVIAWLLSENRRRVRLRLVLVGIGLQVLLGLLLLKLPILRRPFEALNQVIIALEEATMAGTQVVFGYLGGGPTPFEEVTPAMSYVLAFRGLPLVLLMSALSSLLFYWKVLPHVVRGASWLLRRSLGIGGAEGVGVAANIFVGMIEAPLLIRPYLQSLTRSELFTVMTVGMATIAGTMMVLYAAILSEVVPNALGHILTASIISAPAAVVMAKIMIPETQPVTAGDVAPPTEASGTMDAITRGTFQGIQLLLSIVAMIIVLVALVQLANVILRLIPGGGDPITLQRIFGYFMSPAMWMMGIPWSESVAAGALMGTKTVLNELIAYLDLAALPPGTLSERSRVIVMYAMCGFANPGSLGIMIGGMGSMAPERRGEIVALGVRAIIAGVLATAMTGAVVGLFL